jgi:glycolate oxidase FAD binding subunit|tara:strand:+ start:18602 stop:19651 length:1050 start_codon:yes stop_codon:yes gene_type:complete
VVVERAIQDWQAQIQGALAEGTRLRIRGAGSKDFLGEVGAFDADINTQSHQGIIEYAPTELVMTVRAGTPLATVKAVLAEQRQYWPCDPPIFGGAGTVGGAIAAGLSGPGRVAHGAVRDLVLGVGIINGAGKALKFGGQVMKNVAGYDVSRLMTGSFGTLGLITDVSFKVLPLPAAEVTVARVETVEQAHERFLQVGRLPLPCSASAWFEGTSYLRFSGSNAGVEDARQTIGGDVIAADIWSRIRDHRLDAFAAAKTVWRISVPPGSQAMLSQSSLLEWSGAQRWLLDPGFDPRSTLSEGHATLFRAPATDQTQRFQPLSAVVGGIHKRLKHQFDPQGIFNPGRLYQEI